MKYYMYKLANTNAAFYCG